MSLYGNSIYGNAILISQDDNGNGGSGGSDRIISPDTTSSVIAQDSSSISSTGNINYNGYALSNIGQLNGLSSSPLAIVNGSERITLSTGVITNSVPLALSNLETAATPDIYWTGTTNTGLLSSFPGAVDVSCSGTQVLHMINTGVSVQPQLIVSSIHDPSNPDIRFRDSSTTGIYSSITGDVDISCNGVNTLNLSSTNVTAKNQVIIPSAHNVLAPDICFSDATAFGCGIFSSVANTLDFSTSGHNSARLDLSGLLINQGQPRQINNANLEVFNTIGSGLVNFESLNNTSLLRLSRANGSVGSLTGLLTNQTIGSISGLGYNGTALIPCNQIVLSATENLNSTSSGGAIALKTCLNTTNTLLTRMYIDNTGYVGIGTAVPNAILHLNGVSGTTFKMVDTNQAAGKVLASDSSGVGSWTSIDALPRSQGYIYYEPAIGSSSGFAFGVMSTQYLLNVASTLVSSTNFTMPSNGRLTYTGSITRSFKCSINITLTNNSGILGNQIYLWPYKNGSVITGSSTTIFTNTTTTNFYPASMNFLISLATNDYIELYSSNETGTTGINVHTLQMTCV